MSISQRKIDAIFTLRSAAEKKGRAERDVDADPSAEHRDRLLESQIELERATIAALDVAHECAHHHVPEPSSKIVRVDFERSSEQAER